MNLRMYRQYAMLVLGFASGLPLALTTSSLQAWLTIEGISVKTIGALALITTPYSLKPLWAPLLDRYRLGSDPRLGWIRLFLLLLAVAVGCLSLFSPSQQLAAVVALATVVATASASLDVVIDAYRTEMLPPDEHGLGSSISIFGYRLAMLTSGAMGLWLADLWGWQPVYLTMAFVFAGLIVLSFTMPATGILPQVRSLKEAVVRPFAALIKRDNIVGLLLLVFTYKLGDVLAAALGTTFYLELGYSQSQIALASKTTGLIATIGGAIVGGMILTRVSLYRALWIFGGLQAVTNFAFVYLAGRTDPTMTELYAIVCSENLSGGMGTAAYVALIMRLCDKGLAATQYAVLTALMASTRTFISAPSGFLVDAMGWQGYFVTTVVLSVPALILLRVTRTQLVRPVGLTSPAAKPD